MKRNKARRRTVFAHERIAAEAARRLGQLGIPLDFSPASLAAVDGYLDILLPSPLTPEDLQEPEQEDQLLLFGSYVGETIRKCLGGEWNDLIEGTDVASRIQVVFANDELCTPLKPVRERMLGQQEGDCGCLDYFERYREHLGRPAGSSEDAPSWARFAAVMIGAGQVQRAYRLLLRASELDPSLGSVWVTRAETEEKLRRTEDALASYHRAAELLSPHDQTTTEVRLRIAALSPARRSPRHSVEAAGASPVAPRVVSPAHVTLPPTVPEFPPPTREESTELELAPELTDGLGSLASGPASSGAVVAPASPVVEASPGDEHADEAPPTVPPALLVEPPPAVVWPVAVKPEDMIGAPLSVATSSEVPIVWSPASSDRRPASSKTRASRRGSLQSEVAMNKLGDSLIDLAGKGDIDFIDALLDESLGDWASIEADLFAWLARVSDRGSPDEKRAACGAAMVLANRKGFRPEAKPDESEASLRLLERASLALGASLPPPSRARLMLALAAAFSDRSGGDAARNQEEAFQLIEATMPLLDARSQPELWGRAHKLLGTVHGRRLAGNRKEHLEASVWAFRAALRVLTAATTPDLWASTQIDLGNALRVRPSGDRSDNIESAIECFSSALTVLKREEDPIDWALARYALGQCLLERDVTDRVAALEQALLALLDAVSALPPSPELAEAHYRLGLAYQRRKTGERADNLTQAIRHYEQSLNGLQPEEARSAQDNLDAARRELKKKR